MTVKYKIDRKIQKALGIKVQGGKIVRDTSVLIQEIRKDFSIKGPNEVKKAILRDITKGISPVEGFGKFKKYSDSYKDVILGKGMFRKVGGRTVFFEGVRDEQLLSASSPKKKRSPVTLRVTGQLHNALKVFTIRNFSKLVFDWRDFLADIHNRRGAGKKKVVRRMLPTERGESFNKEILGTIISKLEQSAKRIVKRFS